MVHQSNTALSLDPNKKDPNATAEQANAPEDLRVVSQVPNTPLAANQYYNWNNQFKVRPLVILIDQGVDPNDPVSRDIHAK